MDNNNFNYDVAEMNSLFNDSSVMRKDVGNPGNFEVRDSSHGYAKYSFCRKDGKVYRCDVDNFYGAWNSGSWTETNVFDEIEDLRGNVSGYEEVTVRFSKNKGDASLGGLIVTIGFISGSSSSTMTKTTDASGNMTVLVPIGDVYQIQPPEVTGYMILNSGLIRASMKKRIIDMKYIQEDPGMYIIDVDGVQTPVDDWDSSNNERAMFVKYTNSNLQNCPIIIPKFPITTSGVFSPDTEVDYTSVPDFTSANAAKLDFAGKERCEAYVTEATTPDTYNKTYIDKYNEKYSKTLNINGYLPAIMNAYNKTIVFGGQTLHGYVPSFGQLFCMLENMEAFQFALDKIGGGTFPNLSGQGTYWWSSSENSAANCWTLYYGSVNYIIKINSFSVVLLFDLAVSVSCLDL